MRIRRPGNGSEKIKLLVWDMPRTRRERDRLLGFFKAFAGNWRTHSGAGRLITFFQKKKGKVGKYPFLNRTINDKNNSAASGANPPTETQLRLNLNSPSSENSLVYCSEYIIFAKFYKFKDKVKDGESL